MTVYVFKSFSLMGSAHSFLPFKSTFHLTLNKLGYEFSLACILAVEVRFTEVKFMNPKFLDSDGKGKSSSSLTKDPFNVELSSLNTCQSMNLYR